MTSEPILTQEDQGQVLAIDSKARPGWTDEFLTVVLILPAVAAFIPGAQDFVSRGFQILASDAPSWYLGALSVAGAAAFGNKAWPGGLAGLIKSPKG